MIKDQTFNVLKLHGPMLMKKKINEGCLFFWDTDREDF